MPDSNHTAPNVAAASETIIATAPNVRYPATIATAPTTRATKLVAMVTRPGTMAPPEVRDSFMPCGYPCAWAPKLGAGAERGSFRGGAPEKSCRAARAQQG